MSFKAIAKALIPVGLQPALRRAAISSGLLPNPEDAPFEYPFIDLMKIRHPRPNYRWSTLAAALMAKTQGIPRISVIEFGVAGGNGLVYLEQVAEEVTHRSGVQIDVYGFDTGTGLTKTVDYRDLPQMWREGYYGMDIEALKRRLKTAKLVLGPVGETVPKFVATKPAPVGFIAFDMDLYSSTMDAFGLFEGGTDILMPRVLCYFDDIIGFSHSDFTGERLAINEFNAAHKARKISPIYGMRKWLKNAGPWIDMIYLMHAFDHPAYGEFDGWHTLRELPLVE